MSSCCGVKSSPSVSLFGNVPPGFGSSTMMPPEFSGFGGFGMAKPYPVSTTGPHPGAAMMTGMGGVCDGCGYPAPAVPMSPNYPSWTNPFFGQQAFYNPWSMMTMMEPGFRNWFPLFAGSYGMPSTYSGLGGDGGFGMMPPPYFGPDFYLSEYERGFMGEREPWRTRPYPRTRRYPTPLMHQIPSRPSSSMEYYTFQNPVRLDASGNRFLSLVFDLPSYKPEEIRVTFYTKDKYIEVNASHDVKEAKEHAVRRQYDRKYFFPADLNVGDATKLEMRSYLNNEGQLWVEALLPPLSPEEMKRQPHLHYPVYVAPVKVEKMEM